MMFSSPHNSDGELPVAPGGGSLREENGALRRRVEKLERTLRRVRGERADLERTRRTMKRNSRLRRRAGAVAAFSYAVYLCCYNLRFLGVYNVVRGRPYDCATTRYGGLILEGGGVKGIASSRAARDVSADTERPPRRAPRTVRGDRRRGARTQQNRRRGARTQQNRRRGARTQQNRRQGARTQQKPAARRENPTKNRRRGATTQQKNRYGGAAAALEHYGLLGPRNIAAFRAGPKPLYLLCAQRGAGVLLNTSAKFWSGLRRAVGSRAGRVRGHVRGRHDGVAPGGRRARLEHHGVSTQIPAPAPRGLRGADRGAAAGARRGYFEGIRTRGAHEDRRPLINERKSSRGGDASRRRKKKRTLRRRRKKKPRLGAESSRGRREPSSRTSVRRRSQVRKAHGRLARARQRRAPPAAPRLVPGRRDRAPHAPAPRHDPARRQRHARRRASKDAYGGFARKPAVGRLRGFEEGVRRTLTGRRSRGFGSPRRAFTGRRRGAARARLRGSAAAGGFEKGGRATVVAGYPPARRFRQIEGKRRTRLRLSVTDLTAGRRAGNQTSRRRQDAVSFVCS